MTAQQINNSLHRTLKITIQQISNEYKLQCSIINNSNNEETPIKKFKKKNATTKENKNAKTKESQPN